jgi:ABC-type multidrug transport system fused ATPase/permease subunit
MVSPSLARFCRGSSFIARESERWTGHRLHRTNHPARFSGIQFIVVVLTVVTGYASAKRILSILIPKPIWIRTPPGTVRIKGEIQFEHVDFGYTTEGALVLHDVTFHVEPGNTVAIVGQTGSGKSTLTKLINRIYDVNSGRVLIDGVDVRD